MDEKLKKSFVAFRRASTILEKKMVDILLNFVDNTKVLKLNTNCYFFNYITNELEKIEYITTDGNSVFFTTDKNKGFFSMREEGSADLYDIFDAIICEKYTIEKKIWKYF